MFSLDDDKVPLVVDRSSFSSIGSLFHARGAATEKVPSPIRRRVRCTTGSPADDEACTAVRAGTSAISMSEMYTGVSKRRLVGHQAQLVLDPL